MTRISSNRTWVHKRLGPVFLFVVLGGMSFAMLTVRDSQGRKAGPFAFIPLAGGLLAWTAMRKMVFDLVDEVYDCGDSFLVKNAGKEDRISYSNVMNIDYQYMTNPRRVTLTLREPSPLFGSEITFNPVTARMLFFSRDPAIADLIRRVDDFRRSR